MTATPETATADPLAVLEEIRQREQAATKGPWGLVTDSCDCSGDYPCSHGAYPYAIVTPRSHAEPGAAGDPSEYDYQHSEIAEMTMDDAEFIAHAREDIPRLLAGYDALLKLAGSWDESARAVFGPDISLSQTSAKAAELRSVITAALLAEEVPQ